MNGGTAATLSEASVQSAMGQSAAEIERTIAGWVRAQTQYWSELRPGAAAMQRRYADLTRTQPHFFVFDVADGKVSIRDKPHYTRAQLETPMDSFSWRAGKYRDFFTRVAERRGVRGSGSIGMSMHDYANPAPDLPVFAFQRPIGARAILLPDIDAIDQNFYRAMPLDETPFMEKTTAAIFVGSTTGDIHSVGSVAALASARLRAAVFFRGNPLVDFRLPHIVQCDTPEAEHAIRELAIGSARATWPEQYSRKFLISLDGNGATCSRVAMALRSRSVLLKYRSPSELYYFPGLAAGQHYIPIETDADVIATLTAELAQPGRFHPLARASHRFFRDYLTVKPAMSYTAQLLEAYFGCFS